MTYFFLDAFSISTYLQHIYIYISTICNIATHVLIILLMKIKFFRQKRQAAEEKRKEERSALETVRMEYLYLKNNLIIYCH